METAGIKDKVERDDIKIMEVPGVDIAARLGNALARNMVLLGAYVETMKPMRVEAVEEEINRRFGKEKDMLAVNSGAFKEGIKVAATAKS